MGSEGATKRVADEVPKRRGRPGKRSRTTNLVPMVVDAILETEALPADLRKVFEVALPKVLAADKADRHAYEAEIVEQAEKGLVIVQKALEKNHSEFLSKQNEVIAPAEHAKRTKAKKAAEAGHENANANLAAAKEAQTTAKKAVHDAQSVQKAAQKDADRLEKEMQGLVDKKANLTEALENEFVALKEGTSHGPAGKKNVKKLESIGKEYSLDDTLLQTLPITCKKEPETRSEFENMMFTSLKAAIDRQIDGLTQKMAEMEPGKAEKLAAMEKARQAVEKEEANVTSANEAVSAAQAAAKEATKEVSRADDLLYKIWGDMKEACDAQDVCAKQLSNLKENIFTAFQQLKEKEPEPEEEAPEAEEEAPEAEAEAGEAEAAEDAES